MNIREEFEVYRDRNGLIQPIKNPQDDNASGNGLLYTAEFLAVLWSRKEITSKDLVDTTIAFEKCEVLPGLYKRSISHTDQEAQDDYIGVIAANWFIGVFENNRRILDYGRKNFFIYNNVDPKKRWSPSAWFIRYPALIAHMYWGCNKTPPIATRIWSALSLIWSAYSKKQDSKILAWFLIKIADKRSWMVNAATKFWFKKLKKQYPMGMKEVFSIYFNDPSHPCAKYFED